MLCTVKTTCPVPSPLNVRTPLMDCELTVSTVGVPTPGGGGGGGMSGTSSKSVRKPVDELKQTAVPVNEYWPLRPVSPPRLSRSSWSAAMRATASALMAAFSGARFTGGGTGTQTAVLSSIARIAWPSGQATSCFAATGCAPSANAKANRIPCQRNLMKLPPKEVVRSSSEQPRTGRRKGRLSISTPSLLPRKMRADLYIQSVTSVGRCQESGKQRVVLSG